MIEIQGKYLVLLLQKHPALGYLAFPYLVSRSGETIFVLSEKLTKSHVKAWKDDLSPELKKLALLADGFADQELFRRFCKKKKNETASSFLKNTDSDFVESVIKPEVEKMVSEVLFQAMALGVLVFMREDTRSVYLGDAIGFAEKAAGTTMKFTRRDEGIDYQLMLHSMEGDLLIREKHTEIITSYPAWLLYDNRLYFFKKDFDANKVKPFLKSNTIFIPAKMEKEYFRKYIRKSVRGGNVIAEGFDIIDLWPDPEAHLSFEYNPFFRPSLTLSFMYSGKRVEASRPGNVIVDLLIKDDEYHFQKIYRSDDKEAAFSDKLQTMGMRSVAPGQWSLEREDLTNEEFLEWINNNAARLKRNGFSVESNFPGKNYHLGEVSLVQDINAYRDWFDVHMVVVLEDGVKIPFTLLKDHILNEIREYTTRDGLTFVIPEEWFARYRDLCELGKPEKEQFRVSAAFFPVFKKMEWGLPEYGVSEKRADIKIPDNLNAQLRPYQVDGFKWLSLLNDASLGGCLADDMGLGKTIQIITFLLSQYADNEDQSMITDAPVSGQQSLFDFSDVKCTPTLIVMPASLVHNWYLEFQKFAPSMKVYRHTGTTRTANLSVFFEYHVVLTTYGTLRNDIEAMEKMHFKYVILDESQMIKNPDSKTHQAVASLSSDLRFVLSGTPVENSVLDLYAQMDFINPGMLGDREMFKRVFLKPLSKNNDEEKLQKLRNIVDPYVLRRTKSMVAKELPPKMEQILYCEMSSAQQRIYDEEKSKIRNEIISRFEEEMADQNVKFAVLAALTRLRQIACHPGMAGFSDVESGKFNVVLQKVQTVVSEGHKVLMFSSFVSHLERFAEVFDELSLSYEMLTGSTVNRAEVIDSFRSDQGVKVFLISLKAGGVGLNLTEADYVFILDPWWNPAAEAQAIDRTHRIGQEKNVFVYRFISRDTVEEKMLLLQDRKRELADEIIHTGENPIFKMSGEELEGLLM